jgi:hypothetical protein
MAYAASRLKATGGAGATAASATAGVAAKAGAAPPAAGGAGVASRFGGAAKAAPAAAAAAPAPAAAAPAKAAEPKLNVDEYNAAVDAITAQAERLGVNAGGADAAAGAAGAEEEDGFPPIPRLNVGGTEFQCRVADLRSQPGSLLTAVFMGEEECEFDAQGRFFFDQDPTHMNLVLNFMRHGECVIPYERGAFEAFRKDVQFWRLDLLEARCEVHYKKYIQPQLAGEKAVGAAAKRKGPNGALVHARYAARQKELHGALVDRLAEVVHSCLLDGSALGLNRLTLTSMRPPETIGVAGLPAFRPPNWAQVAEGHEADTLFCWDPAFLPFFQPAQGFPALHAARDYFMTRMEEFGFKTDSHDFTEDGMTYHFATTGEAS